MAEDGKRMAGERIVDAAHLAVPGKIDQPVSLITMNMGTAVKKNVTDTGGTDIRRGRVTAYWNNNQIKRKPDIVFAQEISAPVHKRAGERKKWKLFDVDGNYNFLNGDKEAGIAYNSDVFTNIKYIDAGLKDVIDAGFEDKGRLCAVVLMHRKTQLRLLCVSWHGKENKDAVDGKLQGKLELDPKQKRFEGLLRFVSAISSYCQRDEIYKHDAIVIAGDFNLNAHHTRGFRGDFQLPEQSAGIDYFLYKLLDPQPKSSVRKILHNPSLKEGSYGTGNTRPGYLDHKPLHFGFLCTVTRAIPPALPAIRNPKLCDGAKCHGKVTKRHLRCSHSSGCNRCCHKKSECSGLTINDIREEAEGKRQWVCSRHR